MGGGVIAQGGQFLIHFRQFLAGVQGKFVLFEQVRDLLQAFRAGLLPFAGLFLEAFQPFGQLGNARLEAFRRSEVGRSRLRNLCFQ